MRGGYDGAMSSWGIVLTLALGLSPCLAAGAGVSVHNLSHDQSVLDQLPNVLACTITSL